MSQEIPNISVISRGYGWAIGIDGQLYALTAGDMGYEATGIFFNMEEACRSSSALLEFISNTREEQQHEK